MELKEMNSKKIDRYSKVLFSQAVWFSHTFQAAQKNI